MASCAHATAPTSERAAGSAFSVPIIALTTLSFALGCSEYMVVGILPTIAAGLQVDIVSIGSLVSLFAGAYAVCTPVFSFVFARVPRYRLLMTYVIVFIAGNLLAVLSTGYAMFAIARVVTAAVSGAAFSTGMTFIPSLVRVEQRARAIAVASAGFSCATVAGIPVGTLITSVAGWHVTFMAVTALAIVVLLVLARELPRSSDDASGADGADAEDAAEKTPAVPLSRQFAALADARMLLIIGQIVGMAAGIYVYYTYVTPTLTDAMGVPAQVVSLVLAGNGILALVAAAAAAVFAERVGHVGLPIIFAALGGLLLCFPLVIGTGVPAIGVAFYWLLTFVQCLPGATQQVMIMSTAERDYPDALNFAMSFNPTSFNIGIALGSAIGGMVVTATGANYAMLGPAAAVLMAFACACSLGLVVVMRKRAVKRG